MMGVNVNSADGLVGVDIYNIMSMQHMVHNHTVARWSPVLTGSFSTSWWLSLPIMLHVRVSKSETSSCVPPLIFVSERTCRTVLIAKTISQSQVFNQTIMVSATS